MIDQQEVILLQQRIACSNDQPAYVRLYRIYYHALYGFALTYVKTREIAEEIVSDVFVQVWQHRARLEEIHNLTVYLYTCIRNHSLNFLAKEKKHLHLPLEDSSMYIASTAQNPEQRFISVEMIQKIELAVQQLPPRCGLIFKMIREDGLRYREVAEILNVSVKTVEAQVGIALRKISDALQKQFASSYTPLRAVK